MHLETTGISHTRAVLALETPVFLAPRRYRRGIPGRIGPDGREISALDETVVTEQVAQLIEEGIDTLAVSFLFAFLNPAHERRVREIVRMRWPELPISLSSDVDPAFREYERTLVTAFDAYIKPIVNDYLFQLETEIANGVTSVTPLDKISKVKGDTEAWLIKDYGTEKSIIKKCSKYRHNGSY